jgi:hypothetical protein
MNARRLNITRWYAALMGAALVAPLLASSIALAADGECRVITKAGEGCATTTTLSTVCEAGPEGRVVLRCGEGGTLTADRMEIAGVGKGAAVTIADQHTIEVRIDDDDITVKVDGKEVPADRIKKQGGRIIILDEDGGEIESIRIGAGGDEDLFWNYWVQRDVPEDAKLVTVDEPKVMIGIHLDEPDDALRCHLKLEPGTTTLIKALHKGLPAEQAGLGEFDVITKIDGKAPADPASLRAALAEKEPGDVIRLRVIHEGTPTVVRVTLAPYDAQAMAEAELIGQAPAAQVAPELFFLDEGALAPQWKQFTTELPKLRDFFVDENNRIFEFRPGMKMKIQEDADKPLGEPDDLDQRLQRLDKRLAELDKILNDLLKRAAAGTDD